MSYDIEVVDQLRRIADALERLAPTTEVVAPVAPVRRQLTYPELVDEVAEVLRVEPYLSRAEIADRLGITDRTMRRALRWARTNREPAGQGPS